MEGSRRLAERHGCRAIFALAVAGAIAYGCSSTHDAGSAEGAANVSTCDISLAAFFEPEITDAGLETASRSVAQVEGVTHVEVVDHAEALADAARLFADDPQTLALIEDAGAAPSIRVEVTAGPVLDDVEQVLSSTPLVRKVKRTDSEISSELATLIDEASFHQWCENWPPASRGNAPEPRRDRRAGAALGVVLAVLHPAPDRRLYG